MLAASTIHGAECNCKACLLERLDYPRPSEIGRKDLRHPLYRLRIMIANTTMLKDEFYIPNKFNPECIEDTIQSGSCTPQDLFPERTFRYEGVNGRDKCNNRFVLERPRISEPRVPIRMQLVYTDGACSNNGKPNASSAAGIVFSSQGCDQYSSVIWAPMKNQHTSNRAELYAVCDALRKTVQHLWANCDALVIATDSTYVVNGATRWIPTWIENGWRTASDTKVSNQDLWEDLLARVGILAIDGCQTMLWHIPRELNTVADRLAKRGCEKSRNPQPWW